MPTSFHFAAAVLLLVGVTHSAQANCPPAICGLPDGCFWCPVRGCGTGLSPPYSKSSIDCSADGFSKNYDPVGLATQVAKLSGINKLRFRINIPPKNSKIQPSDETIANAFAALQTMQLDSLFWYVGAGSGLVTPGGVVQAIVFSGALKSSLKQLELDMSLWSLSNDNVGTLGANVGVLSSLRNASFVLDSGTERNFGGAGVSQFLNNLAKSGQIARLVLDVSDGNVHDSDMKQIGTNLAQFAQLTSLIFIVGNSGLSDTGVPDLAQSLQSLKTLTDVSLDFNTNRISGDGFKNLVAQALKIPNIQVLGTSLKDQTPPLSPNDVHGAAQLVSQSRGVGWNVGVVQSNTNTSEASNAMACALACAGSQIVTPDVEESTEVGYQQRSSGDASCSTIWSINYSFESKCLEISSFESGAPGLCPGTTDSRCVSC